MKLLYMNAVKDWCRESSLKKHSFPSQTEDLHINDSLYLIHPKTHTFVISLYNPILKKSSGYTSCPRTSIHCRHNNTLRKAP